MLERKHSGEMSMLIRTSIKGLQGCILSFILVSFTACATHGDIYRDPNMDFGAIRTVAIMPFVNLTRDQLAAERVRDVFMTMLLATGGVYVVPQGEVARAALTGGITNPTAPTKEEILKFATFVKADAVITGVVREYGEVRSGTTSANVISLSLQMIEAQTGKIVWSASSTKGGIGMKERLLGGGGEPLNDSTEKAVKDVINKLFK
jgi:hypothetical protein